MITTDREKFSYWEGAKIKDLIQLSDEQTISYLMENGCDNIEHGADFEIRRIRNIKATNSSSRWIVMDISLKDFVWFVIVKTADSEVDIKVFYIPDDFQEGSRQDILDADFRWLFEEPEDLDNYDPMKLNFPSKIEEDNDVVFETEGAEYGDCWEGEERSFSTIVEYFTESDIENPEMIILEFNNIKEWSNEEENEDDFGNIEVKTDSGVLIDEENSFVTFMQGCKVNISDIKLLK